MFEKVEKIILGLNRRIQQVDSELLDLRGEVRHNRRRPMYGTEWPFYDLQMEEDTDFLD